MCDVIKIRLKRKDERRRGKGIHKKQMDLDVFLKRHMPLSVSPKCNIFG